MKFRRKQDVLSSLEPRRILVIYGPRRVGKTTLLEAYLKTQLDKRVYYSTGDDIELREIFKSESRAKILDLARPYEIIALDEAQYIPSIGIGAKMMIDAFPDKKIILTGSSSLDLSNKIGEPLTGRHFTLTLLPISQIEMDGSRFELGGALEDFLIYGFYPEVLDEPNKERKIKILAELVSSYLFKDALALGVGRYLASRQPWALPTMPQASRGRPGVAASQSPQVSCSARSNAALGSPSATLAVAGGRFMMPQGRCRVSSTSPCAPMRKARNALVPQSRAIR